MSDSPDHRILILQEQPDLGRLWARHLERMGATVELFTSSDAAIARIEEAPFAAVIIDLLHSEAQGLSVADVAAFRQPDLSVIFVTSSTFFADGSIFRHCQNARAILRSTTPPDDLAKIVLHYGQGRDVRPA